MAAVPYNSVWIPGEKTSVSTALEAGARNSPLRHRFLVYFGGDCSARGRDPEVSAGEFGEDVEGPAAVFGRGGQVGAHRDEVLGAGLFSPSADGGLEELREEAASCRSNSAIRASCSAIRACSWAIVRSCAATSATSCS